MSISQNLNKIKSSIPSNVTLVAVSKTKPVADLMEAYDAGQRVFGENYVQELVEKHEQLPKDIQWHFIGHLQSKKVKLIAPFVSLIHGVDSLKLLEEINKQAQKNNRIIDVLLQISIAEEDTKFGLEFDEVSEIIEYVYDDNKAPNIRIVGLMAMATNTDDENQIENEFGYLIHTFNVLNLISSDISIKSIGMSADYKIAIKCGSNMVRIGSSIFGSRN
jgi:PLP dependent protein